MNPRLKWFEIFRKSGSDGEGACVRTHSADAAVMRYYRMLIQLAQGVAAGGKPVGVDADPMRITGRNASVPHGADWRSLVPGHNVTNRWRGAREPAAQL